MFDVLKNILTEKLGIEESLIAPNAYIKRDLELDSTETVVVALEIKKRIGIDYELPEGDLTLNDIMKSIAELETAK